MNELALLRPYNPSETIGTAEAAKLAGVCEYTIRIWCGQYQIGRRVAGRWRISRVALGLLINGEALALAAYVDGKKEFSALGSRKKVAT